MMTQYHEGERITCSAHSNFPIDSYVWKDEGEGVVIKEGKDAASLVISGSWLQKTRMIVRCTVKVTVDGELEQDSINVTVSPGY